MTLPHFADADVDEIRDLYDAERQPVKALPKMARQLTRAGDADRSPPERDGRSGGAPERAFELLNERSNSRRCAGIAASRGGSRAGRPGLTARVRDAAIIAGTAAEQYEWRV
jgi:ferritin-like metal-binding protein YciE